LKCRRLHHVGLLQIDRGDRVIEYWHADNSSQPEWWYLTDMGMFSQRCPGGCRQEVGAPRHDLMQRLIALCEDQDRDEDTFILTDVES
jgi:hypothetical protein